MQTLLDDIELDIQNLRCLMQAIESDVNPTLRVVAKRNVLQMKMRLDTLFELLEEPITTVPLKSVAPVTVTHVYEEQSISESKESASDFQVLSSEVQTLALEPPIRVSDTTQPVNSSTSSILAERIKPATDLRHAISLNDSFRFTRELFGGDAVRMNEVVRQLSETSSLDKALDILNSTIQPDEENVVAADFVELLKKYFS